MSGAVEKFGHANFNNQGVTVAIGKSGNAVNQNVSQKVIYCGNERGKLLALREFIKDGFRPPAILFTETKERCQVRFFLISRNRKCVFSNNYWYFSEPRLFFAFLTVRANLEKLQIWALTRGDPLFCSSGWNLNLAKMSSLISKPIFSELWANYCTMGLMQCHSAPQNRMPIVRKWSRRRAWAKYGSWLPQMSLLVVWTCQWLRPLLIMTAPTRLLIMFTELEGEGLIQQVS